MKRDERDKLWEVYGTVSEIAGELPHLARKEDITNSIAAHERRLHFPAQKRWTRAKTRLVVAVTALIVAATTTLIAWRPWE